MIKLNKPSSSFASNFIANVFSFFVGIVISLWFTAFLIKKLGPAAFGLIPLSTTLASYMSVLTSSLTSSVGRSVTVAYGSADNDDMQRVFNAAFFGCLFLTLLLLPLVLVVAYFAPGIISIPHGYYNQSRILFATSGCVFLLTTLITPYGIALFVRNRLDLSSYLTTASSLLKVFIVWLLFLFTDPSLWQVAIGLFVSTCFTAIITYIVSRQLMPVLKVRWNEFTVHTFRTLASTGVWVSIAQFGAMLLLSFDLLLVNIMISSFAAGNYSIPLQLAILLRQAFTIIGGLFAPTIMTLYGSRDKNRLTSYTIRAIYFLGYFAAVTVGLFCGFANSLFRIWLGENFSYLTPLSWLMIGPLAINLAVFPMFSLSLTLNKVRGPALVTLIFGLLHVGLSYLLVTKAHWGYYGVAASSIILLSIKNLAYIPWYTAISSDMRPITLYVPLFRVALATILVWLIAALVNLLFSSSSWFALLFHGALATIISTFILYKCFFDNEMRLEFYRRFREVLMKSA